MLQHKTRLTTISGTVCSDPVISFGFLCGGEGDSDNAIVTEKIKWHIE